MARTDYLACSRRSIFILQIISIPGIPKGVVNVVYGKGDVIGKAMAEHPTVKALALVNIDYHNPSNFFARAWLI